MNNQDKKAAEIVLAVAGTIGGLYKFWLENGDRIKTIVKPLLEICADAQEKNN